MAKGDMVARYNKARELHKKYIDWLESNINISTVNLIDPQVMDKIFDRMLDQGVITPPKNKIMLCKTLENLIRKYKKEKGIK